MALRPDDRPNRPVGTGLRADRQRAEFIRRQRLLRAKGFPVIVDGIWGPRSRASWARYVQGQPPARSPLLPPPPPKIIKDERSTEDILHTQRKALLARQQELRQQAEFLAKAGKRGVEMLTDVKRRQAVQAEHIRVRSMFDREENASRIGGIDAMIGKRPRIEPVKNKAKFATPAERAEARELGIKQFRNKQRWLRNYARSNPPDKLNTRHILALYGSDEAVASKWWTKPKQVKKLQVWLRLQGEKVEVNGRFDKKVYDALDRQRRTYLAEERRRAINEVVQRIYKPLDLKPGDPHPLLGKVPEPGELMEILQEGGFTAELLFEQLSKKAFNANVGFLLWREKQLDELMRGSKQAPLSGLLGVFAPPDFVKTENLSAYGAQVAALQAIVGGGFDPEQRGDIGAEQVLALGSATTGETYQRLLRKIQRRDEMQYIRSQSQNSQDSRAWWEYPILALTEPANKVQDLSQDAFAWLVTLADATGDAEDKKSDTFRAIQAFQKDVLTYPVYRERLEQWERDNPWLDMAWELAVDPLWFTGGAPGSALRGTKLAALALEETGLELAARGGVRQIGHVLTVPAVVGRETGLRARYVKEVLKYDVYGTRHAYEAGVKLSRTIYETRAVVNRSIRAAMRHSFHRPYTPKSALGEADSALGAAITGETAALEREAYDEFRSIVEEQLGPVWKRFVREGIPIYTTDSRLVNGETRVANAVAAYITSQARAVTIHSKALDARWEAVKKARAAIRRKIEEGTTKGGGTRVVELKVRIPGIRDAVTIKPGIDSKEMDKIINAAAEQAGADAYKEALQLYGSYLFGNGDLRASARLFEDATVTTVIERLDQEMAELQDFLFQRLLPVLQDVIEDHRATYLKIVKQKRGIDARPLFDENGRATAGNRGDLVDAISQQIKGAFDEMEDIFDPGKTLDDALKDADLAERLRVGEERILAERNRRLGELAVPVPKPGHFEGRSGSYTVLVNKKRPSEVFIAREGVLPPNELAARHGVNLRDYYFSNAWLKEGKVSSINGLVDGDTGEVLDLPWIYRRESAESLKEEAVSTLQLDSGQVVYNLPDGRSFVIDKGKAKPWGETAEQQAEFLAARNRYLELGRTGRDGPGKGPRPGRRGGMSDAQKEARAAIKSDHPLLDVFHKLGAAKKGVTTAITPTGVSAKTEGKVFEDLVKEIRKDAADQMDALRAEVRAEAEKRVVTNQRTFTIEIDNAMYGKYLNDEEWESFLKFRIREASRRIHRQLSIRKLAGEKFDDDVASRLIDEFERKLRGQWVRKSDKGWTPRNKKTILPKVYARELEETWGPVLDGRHPFLVPADVPEDVAAALGKYRSQVRGGPAKEADKTKVVDPQGDKPPRGGLTDQQEIAAVGAPPGQVTGESFVTTLNRIAFLLANGSPRNFNLMSKYPAVFYTHFAQGSRFAEEHFKAVRAMKNFAATGQLVANEMRSGAYLREMALWRALMYSNGKAGQIAYTMLQGWLDIWTTYTLPLRPAFWVRNVVDNVSKTFIEGQRNPMSYTRGAEKPFEENVASQVQTAISQDLRALRHALTIGGRAEGNPAVKAFDAVIDSFWRHPNSVIKKVFAAHAIEVPEEAIEGMRLSSTLFSGVDTTPPVRLHQNPELWLKYGIDPKKLADEVDKYGAPPHPEILAALSDSTLDSFTMFAQFHDWARHHIWDLVVSRPEAYAKRALYRDVYAREIKRGATAHEAYVRAMKSIEDTLFDYSKLSTMEENLKWLFPFAFFWRKTSVYWAKQVWDKPWLPAEFLRFEDKLLNEAHADWPSWMRRYVDANPLVDLLNQTPLRWIAPDISSHDVMLDPINYFSFVPLYKLFKSDNQSLPPDRAGVRFLSDLIDGINQTGLSMNPGFRKPLELAGVFNLRSWQSVFPQTSLVEAFTRDYLNEAFPNGLNIEALYEDGIFQLFGSSFSASEQIASRFTEFVQVEMAAQEARGEPVSRKAAEEKIRSYFYVQSVVGFFVGTYLRNMDPATFHLYEIAEGLYDNTADYTALSEQEKRAYQIFRRRRLSALELDQWQRVAPLIEAYYSIGSYEEGEKFKQKHPQIIQYVEPAWRGKAVFSKNRIAKIALSVDSATASQVLRFVDEIDADPDIRDLAEKLFVTRKLKNYWAKFKTPKEARAQMIRGELFRYIRDLEKEFFAIPEKDQEARQGFRERNPVLAEWWQRNEDESDDIKDVLNAVNADLRETYFAYVDKDRWDDAAKFLKRFPFIFEFTKSANRVTDDGLWLPAPEGSAQATAYLRAKRHIDYYWELKKRNKQAAYRWLNSGSEGAKIVLEYFNKYGDRSAKSRSQHAKDYLAMKSELTWFFDTLPDEGEYQGYYSKWEWAFNDKSARAKALRDYFRKYASKGGTTEHAKDYLAAKDDLKFYFDWAKRDPAAAREWLSGGSARAEKVRAYFKKYGKTNKYARKWRDWVSHENPEISLRLKFWQRYFQLEPHKRPAFIHANAEKYGIFVWGIIGEQERKDREMDYLRKAKRKGLSDKVASWLRVKPLLDLYFTIKDPTMKGIFLRANPDVQSYLDRYSKGTSTGNKQLDSLLERYFKLPFDSRERSQLLIDHPEIQDYFDSRHPEDAAIHNLLEKYFEIEDPDERRDFKLRYPEIDDYFERKREERANAREISLEFDVVDPRLRKYFDRAESEIVAQAEMQRYKLALSRIDKLAPDTVETRRGRRPASLY